MGLVQNFLFYFFCGWYFYQAQSAFVRLRCHYNQEEKSHRVKDRKSGRDVPTKQWCDCLVEEGEAHVLQYKQKKGVRGGS